MTGCAPLDAYLTGVLVWAIFALSATLGGRIGINPNNPVDRALTIWGTRAILATAIWPLALAAGITYLAYRILKWTIITAIDRKDTP